jgi:hypothetical protein
MTFFEYVAVLVSIIVALGIAQILSGVARTIEKPQGQRVYWVHLVWAAWLFVYLIFFWWFEFRLGQIEEWTFYGYLVVVLYATLLFFLSALLFPSREHDGVDFEKRFFARRKWFFGLLIFFLVIDLLDTLLKGEGHLGDLGSRYLILNWIFAAAFIGGMVTTNRRFHASLAVIYLVAQLQWIFERFFQIA